MNLLLSVILYIVIFHSNAGSFFLFNHSQTMNSSNPKEKSLVLSNSTLPNAEPILEHLIDRNGNLYIVREDGLVECYLGNGKLLWTYQYDSNKPCIVTVTRNNGILLHSANSRIVCVLSNEGSLIWKGVLTEECLQYPCVVARDRVFFITRSSKIEGFSLNEMSTFYYDLSDALQPVKLAINNNDMLVLCSDMTLMRFDIESTGLTLKLLQSNSKMKELVKEHYVNAIKLNLNNHGQSIVPISLNVLENNNIVIGLKNGTVIKVDYDLLHYEQINLGSSLICKPMLQTNSQSIVCCAENKLYFLDCDLDIDNLIVFSSPFSCPSILSDNTIVVTTLNGGIFSLDENLNIYDIDEIEDNYIIDGKYIEGNDKFILLDNKYNVYYIE